VQPFPDGQLRLPYGIVARNQPCNLAKKGGVAVANHAPKIYKADVRAASYHTLALHKWKQSLRENWFAIARAALPVSESEQLPGSFRPATSDGIDPNR
jgi:hypothetical protein